MSQGAAESSGPAFAFVHLSGPRRGSTQVLQRDEVAIGSGPEAGFRLDGSRAVAPLHAHLEREDDAYTIRIESGAQLWLNGRSVNHAVLESGDVLEIGQGGPVLRFREFPPGKKPFKSVKEAFSDCWECARHDQGGIIARTRIMLAGVPRELARQTAPAFRLGVVFLLALLGIAMSALVVRSLHLERRIEQEAIKVDGVAELLEQAEENTLRTGDLADVQTDFEGKITDAFDRLDALEARTRASQRVVSDANRSVAFLQGSYGFVDADTGQVLRFTGLDDSGRPLLDPDGDPIVALAGDGPPVENFFTGTGFVAHRDGYLVTNRHVATPWEFDSVTQLIAAQGLKPKLNRFIGYLPGVKAAFRVELLASSDEADVAILLCEGVAGEVPVLPLSDRTPTPGQEVIVLGYPTGVRALLARSGEEFMEEIRADEGWDFWSLARRLSEEGLISTLATRGIVGQVSEAAVVYDAETTSGGSGGPVLDLQGHVIAVNAAILPEFGGSNLGVPASQALQLLETVVENRTEHTPRVSKGDPAQPEGISDD